MDRTFKELKQVPSGSQLLHQNSAKRFKTYVLKRFLFYIYSKKVKKAQFGIKIKSWGLGKKFG